MAFDSKDKDKTAKRHEERSIGKNLNQTTRGILGKNAHKVGTYAMSTGGGTPLKKGQKAPSEQWLEENRNLQPRDEEGHFTYNSVNGKSLKYGPSRGTTVSPVLHGLELKFITKGSILKTEEGERLIATIDMSTEQVVANLKEYNEKESGFAGFGEGTTVRKMGRESKVEKESEAGFVNQRNVEDFSENTQKKIEEGANNTDRSANAPLDSASLATSKNMPDDTLNPDGSTTRRTEKRYWELAKKGLRDRDFSRRENPSVYDSKTGKINLHKDLAQANPERYYETHKDFVDNVVKSASEENSDIKIDKDKVIDWIAKGIMTEDDFESGEEEEEAMKIFNL